MSEPLIATANSNPVIQTLGSSLESEPSSKYKQVIMGEPSRELSNSLLSSPHLNGMLDDPNKPITPDDLKNWSRIPEVGEAIARSLGLPTEGLIENKRVTGIKSPLPDCTTDNITCGLILSDNGEVLLVDFAEQYSNKTYTLPNLAASIAYKKLVKLKGPSFAVWRLRLFLEAGLIHPAIVHIPPCPNSETKNTKKVYDGFIRLLQCKWRYVNGYGEPTMFTKSFIAGWCGVTESSANRAMQKLINENVIRKVGMYKKKGRRACGLFLPVDGDNKNGT